MSFTSRFIGPLNAMALCVALPTVAHAQVPVFDAINYARAVAADVKTTVSTQASFVQQVEQTAQLVQQVRTMIADHVSLSSLLQGAGGKLLSTIEKNDSIISSDMGVDNRMLADFQKISPNYNGTQSYLNYYATLRRNANAQYASALSMTQAQLKQEGGVAGAVETVTGNHAANEFQGIEQLVGIGQIQTTQMDSLIKIQAAMLKSMTTYYSQAGAGAGSSMFPSQQVEAARSYCLNTVPGYAELTGANKTAALTNCQRQMKNAVATENGG